MKIKTKGMHIGNYLEKIIREKRYPVSDVAKMVNKSETAVRKDFEKKIMNMGAIEAYAKVLHINIYQVLSQVWDMEHDSDSPKEYSVDHAVQETIAQESAPPVQKPKRQIPPVDRLTVSLDITGVKKEEILKLIFEK